MTTVYPMTGLLEAMQITQASFNASRGQENSGTGAGIILAKDLRPTLWQAKFTSRAVPHGLALQYQARLNALQGSIFSFYGFNPMARYPQSDITGAVLGAHTVKIAALGDDNKSLSFKGLPAAYKLTLGDFFCFDYGAPSARAFHQILESVTADGAGNTDAFEVYPNIRPGAAVNAVVTLKTPTCEMKVIPGTDDLTTQDRYRSVFSFQARQNR
ncbi:MAG TPA: hypothetical protein VIM56_06140 [Rhizomicrobium sp.]